MTSLATDERGGSIPHVRALDGIRGLAILLVMVHHFTFVEKSPPLDAAIRAASKMGWTGVDLFFVLSGFLITSILLKNKGTARYYAAFYGRRLLRIFPLYYLVLAVTLCLLPYVVDLGTVGDNSIWFWLHLSNIQIAFDGFQHKSLDIAWSLSIEEQFYLVWPVVVSAVSRRNLPYLCVAMVVLSAGVRLALSLAGASWAMTYVLTPCRLDGLALGSLLACISMERLRAVRQLAWPVALISAALVAAIVGATRSTHMEGVLGQTVGYTFVAFLWGALLVLALTEPLITRALSIGPLVVLGKYSYALYLLHLPVAFLLRDALFPTALWPRIGGSIALGQAIFHILAGTAALGLAWVSWRFFEQPILSLKRHFQYERR